MTASNNAPNSQDLSVHLEQASPIALDVVFSCHRGELVALVGPSGSGKSSVLRCIAGLNTPTKGRVTCNGVEWLDTDRDLNRPPQQRAIGIVFQNYALFPHLSAVENVSIAIRDGSSEQRRKRAQRLLEMVNLGGLEQRKPHQLSGGQQQRVALARALAREPSALLLDEPFSSVDQATRRKLQRELAALRRQMVHPIILVTHDLEEACLLADRICILHHGQGLQIGTPTEVLSRPKHKLAAHLVGLTNVFEGEIIEHRTSTKVTILRWLGYSLETLYRPEFTVGQSVEWVIPPQHILFHQRVRPSRGERENPVHGVVAEMVVLGDNASITMLVDKRDDTPITFNLPVHVVHRNHLEEGDKISVSLQTNGIHMMLPQVAHSE